MKAGGAELERAIRSIEESVARLEVLEAELGSAIAAQRSAARRLRELAGTARAPIAAGEIVEAVALDDELMTDLDALVEMDTADLASAVRDRPRASSGDVDGAADRAVLRTYQAVLADMERQGVRSARAIVPARHDVYRYLLAAADQVAMQEQPINARGSGTEPGDPLRADESRHDAVEGSVR